MAMTDLPFEQVRTLLAVVDEGTFDAAAKVLHVTPSAVSQRIKALEQSTGRVLLMRTKPARPTESGQTVVRYARQLATLEREVRAGLGAAEDGSPPGCPSR
ncbi:LysR family transcriptional regulator [Actinomadura keratinilytica]